MWSAVVSNSQATSREGRAVRFLKTGEFHYLASGLMRGVGVAMPNAPHQVINQKVLQNTEHR
jgi:hypothetical protein